MTWEMGNRSSIKCSQHVKAILDLKLDPCQKILNNLRFDCLAVIITNDNDYKIVKT